MTRCPACPIRFDSADFSELAEHFCDRAAANDADHIRFLNQNVSKRKVDPPELAALLAPIYELDGQPLSVWIRRRFIARFYGPHPHPFVAALQRPSREVLLGYVIEHQHFLRQWVRSCAAILAHSDSDDVVQYEIENIVTEFGGRGPGSPSHYELLLRMGESLGRPRGEILRTPPLPVTRRSIEGWTEIASGRPWVEALGAMHSLELIAHRDLVREGASVHYFDPGLLEGTQLTEPTKAFLREGYAADVGHSDEALRLVDEHAGSRVRDVQGTVLRSFDLFDDYLAARLERAEELART